mmetsp:Transcript_532/g.1142  ORF Transcript_532/g.1142 Transcript_532/m.1142 type:complete len:309 (-) Transcript_532:367-1293(-)
MFNISLLPSLSGSGISICTSKRPGLKRASSNNSRRFVIPIINTLGMASTPSNLARIWFTVELRVASPLSSAELRFRNVASISSMTMTWRADREASPLTDASSASASWKSSRTRRSEPPTQRSSSSGAETILGALARNALAISLANAVLPHPGGPYNSKPLTGVNPSNANSSASNAASDNCFDAPSSERRRSLSSFASSPSSSAVVVVVVASSFASAYDRRLPPSSTSAGRMTRPSNTLRTMESICVPRPPTRERKSEAKASFRSFPWRVMGASPKSEDDDDASRPFSFPFELLFAAAAAAELLSSYST